jgi:hypothetical protein
MGCSLPSFAGAQAPQKTDAQVPQKDEPLIYAAVIDELFAGKQVAGKPVKTLLLEGNSRFDDFEGEKAVTGQASASTLFKGLKPETMQSFIRQNAQSSPITSQVKSSVKLLPIDSKMAQETVNNNKWKALYTTYPDCAGIISLSKIGFDKAGRQALVYVSHMYGEDTGQGTIVLLQKTGLQWKVQEKLGNWTWTG